MEFSHVTIVVCLTWGEWIVYGPWHCVEGMCLLHPENKWSPAAAAAKHPINPAEQTIGDGTGYVFVYKPNAIVCNQKQSAYSHFIYQDTEYEAFLKFVSKRVSQTKPL